MITPGIVMVVTAAIVAIVVLRPRLAHVSWWRATVTPLASIIGSGFLVSGPILAHAVGGWAWLAMLGLCLAAYLFGAAIRRNIRFVETIMADAPPRTLLLLERASDLALAFAYFVSVAYYLNLFASFALRADDLVDPVLTRWLSSTVIVALGVLGVVRGLGALENVEVASVGLKLSLISGLLAALALSALLAVSEHHLTLPAVAHAKGLHQIGILLGLVILVQGFETSRYLGSSYDQGMRIRTMRFAQLLSAAIYVAFILLITPFFAERLPAVGGETQIITMLTPLGAVFGPLIILAALASQLSTAVADLNGAGGLLADSTGQRIDMRIGYLITAAVALAITWSANIFEIIVYASKAFVFYYALQSIVAALVAFRPGPTQSWRHGFLFLGGTLLSVLVLLFGIPAEGG